MGPSASHPDAVLENCLLKRYINVFYAVRKGLLGFLKGGADMLSQNGLFLVV